MWILALVESMMPKLQSMEAQRLDRNWGTGGGEADRSPQRKKRE